MAARIRTSRSSSRSNSLRATSRGLGGEPHGSQGGNECLANVRVHAPEHFPQGGKGVRTHSKQGPGGFRPNLTILGPEQSAGGEERRRVWGIGADGRQQLAEAQGSRSAPRGRFFRAPPRPRNAQVFVLERLRQGPGRLCWPRDRSLRGPRRQRGGPLASLSLSNSVSGATAVFAAGPIFPRAPAASQRRFHP